MRLVAWLAFSSLIVLHVPQSVDISGTWVATREGMGGQIELVWELKITDGKITGVQKLPNGDAPIIDGRIDGRLFEFTIETELPSGEIQRQIVKGEIEGDALHITLPAGGRRGGPPPGARGEGRGPGPGPGPGPGRGGPGFATGPVVARRGTPTPTYRAGAIRYADLPKLELPALKDLPYNGLAKTPPMGWNSWNKFRTRIDDRTVREIADALVATGMRDAGYQYVNIDDGWQWKRDAKGILLANPNFPDMKALADYVHSKGLKLGIYSSPGPRTCGGFEGSYGHEEIDAKTWAAWGIDYLKYDWCSASRIWSDDKMQSVYQRMAKALRRSGRSIVYSICQYGRANVHEWGARAGGNLWRTTFDIRDDYAAMANIGFAQSDLAPFSGPGKWNDPDMLEVGNGAMSGDEYRMHFSVWALLAAPLIAGNDLRTMSDETKSILLNKEVIAVDQDRLGRAGSRVSVTGDTEVWARPLARGALAVGLFNRGTSEARIRVSWGDLKMRGSLHVRDLWAHADRGRVADGFESTVPAHGVVLLRLTP